MATDTEPIKTTYIKEVDMDIGLKQQLKELYPSCDGLMLENAIHFHRKLVEQYGENYDPEVLEQEWEVSGKLKIYA